MESKSKRYQPLFEMATIDKVDKLTVIVYTDHMPKHFHVLKKDAFEITINLNTLKIIDYNNSLRKVYIPLTIIYVYEY